MMMKDPVLINDDMKESRSTPSIVDDFMYGSNVAQSHVTVRLGFLRKVYGILTCQLAFTTVVAAFIMMSVSTQEFLKNNSWIMIANLLATFATMMVLMFKRTEYPLNYYLLIAFTFFESLSIGFIASFYETWTVVQAFFLTTVIVLCLTAYTFQSKRDFRPMGAVLFSFLTLMFFGSLFMLFFPSNVMHTAMAVFGAFLFSAFIVFDTHMIMKHLHAEEYIVGVINLYLDIINLFLEILKIIDALKRN